MALDPRDFPVQEHALDYRTLKKVVRNSLEFSFADAARAPDPFDDGAHRDAARGVGLRIEEDLRVPYPLLVRTSQVRHREIVEVCFLHQHRARLVVPRQVLAGDVARKDNVVGRPALTSGEAAIPLERPTAADDDPQAD